MQKAKIDYPSVAAGDKPMGPAPLSPAIKKGPFLYISGQVGIDPLTGAVVSGGVAEQTRQTMENIKALVEAAGLTMDDIVKCQVFLTDIGDFAAMNAVYAEYFSAPAPARSTIGIVLAHPDLVVEIEAVAIGAL